MSPTGGIVRGVLENFFEAESIRPFSCLYQDDSLRKETCFVSFLKTHWRLY